MWSASRDKVMNSFMIKLSSLHWPLCRAGFSPDEATFLKKIINVMWSLSQER